MMRWKKLGVIVAPDPDIQWMASHAGPAFAVSMDDGTVKIWLTGRDMQNVSRIGIVTVALLGEQARVIQVSPEPVFDVGMPGTFDENGVSYPWLVFHDDTLYMYYVGWVAGGRNGFQNYTGLAVSRDDGRTFRRVKRVPVLDRTDAEPFGTGSCCVFIEEGIWKMYYTSFDEWEEREGKNRPHYNIKFASSEDGVNWKREKKIIIGYSDAGEHIIGKPMMIREEGLYKLWYSCRGQSYRIGYAESADGLTYMRKDDEAGITVSSSGWDSEMIEYAFVFDHRGARYMIYNGNDFGRTGLGLAILER